MQSETHTYHSITFELFICNNSITIFFDLHKINYLEVLLDQLYLSIKQHNDHGACYNINNIE